MDDDELQEALGALGSSDVPEPDPTFADALEERLRRTHGTGHGVPVPSVPGPRRALVAVAAAVLLVVALGTALVQRSDGSTTRLTAATDTSVVLPDGSIIAAVDGAELPDGALVITGPEGSAVIDDVRIPENSQAIIRDGTAVAVSTPPTTPTTHPASPTTANPSPPTTTATTRPVSPTTATTAPPATSPDTRPTKPSTTFTTTRSEPTQMELAARREPPQAVALRWSMYREPDFDRYVLMRTADGGDKSQSTTIVFTTQDRDVLTFVDKLPDGVDRAAYRVLALDNAGRVVGASPIVMA